VRCGLLFGDATGIDQRLHERVIVGELLQLVIAKQIRAGITHVHKCYTPTEPIQPRDGGSHPG